MKYICVSVEQHKKLCEIFDVKYNSIDFEIIELIGINWSAFKGLNHTEYSKEKIRQANLGEKNPMFGKKHHIVVCPHCKKSGAKNGMKRWHFDNCRLNILT